MRRRPVRFVVSAVLATTMLHATVFAGDLVRVDGPVTGTEYIFDYSCLGLAFNDVRRSDANRSIEIELETFDGDGNFAGGTGGSFLSGSKEFFLARSFSNGLRQGSWRYTERFEGEGDFVEVASGEIDCVEPASQPTTVFVPIEPTRVLDTRPAAAINFAGAKPGPGSSLTVPATDMPEMPDGVVAVSANVGLVASTARGFVQMLPSQQEPGATSSLNASGSGENVLNLAVSPVGPDGAIQVFTSGGSHLTVDINGYFVESDGPETAGRVVSIDPERPFDTRIDGRRATAGTTTTIDLTSSGLPSAGASAAIVNIGATRTAAGRGFVQAAGGGSLVPGQAAILNTFGENDSVAALALVPVTDGAIDVFTSVDTHLFVDVFGWVTDESAAASESGRFVPLQPERLFDSRYAAPVNYNAGFPFEDGPMFGEVVKSTGPTGERLPGVSTRIGIRGLQVDFRSDEVLASSVFANIALVNSAGRGYLSAGAKGRVDIDRSNVNASRSDQNVTNAAVVPFSDQQAGGAFGFNGIEVYTSGGGHILVDVLGFFTK
ncbi:MAG: hypothetical protein WA964_14695 [Ilumatobacter sp.]|uniref:hypothetical protein n=1 Tax=Ilumatobacter sp. TaxID=1967498 RepID=UPI003C743F96